MLLILFLTAATLFIVWIKWNYSYWKRKGFVYVEPQIPFGVLESVRKRERSLGMAIYDIYKSRTEKFLGIYLATRPALLVRDAHLSHDILTKNFPSFHDRGVYVDEERDPMSGGLFFLKGKSWKTLRTKLTPAFTSGKLKAMFPTVLDVSNKLIDYINSRLSDEGSVVDLEMKTLSSIYAIDIVASTIFGLDVNSFKDPNNEFYLVSRKLNLPTKKDVLRGTCQFLYPSLESVFVWLGWKEEAREIMREIVRRTVEYREQNNVSRKDMLQLLLQLRNSGKLNADDDAWSAKATAGAQKSMSRRAAQLFLFYVAGFETSASSTAFTIYELAQNPEILAKAQTDVKQAIEKHGELSYEAINDMKYLELCFMETIRKYPGLPILNRECTEDFVIPDTETVITKGTPIIISLYGIHRDAEYFPDPLKYDPERFLPENMRYDPVAYMPFGEGPRHCIAQRAGKVNVKVALAQILSNFDIVTKSERKEIEIDSHGIPIMPKGGVPVCLTKKNSGNIRSN